MQHLLHLDHLLYRQHPLPGTDSREKPVKGRGLREVLEGEEPRDLREALDGEEPRDYEGAGLKVSFRGGGA